MEETESQLVRVLELSYGPRTFDSRDGKELLNEWMIARDKSRHLLIIWREISLFQAYLGQSCFQLLFSISYISTALDTMTFLFTLIISCLQHLQKIKRRSFKSTCLSTFPTLTHGRCEPERHWALRMKVTHFQPWVCIMLSIGDEACPSPERVGGHRGVSKAGREKGKLERFLAPALF